MAIIQCPECGQNVSDKAKNVFTGSSSVNSDSNGDSISHTNCLFIGYADPNRPLTGQTIISAEPKYGYRPVYTDRSDIYNTYHFH